MDLNKLSPFIRQASATKVNGPYLLQEREIFDYDLMYVYEGSARAIIAGSTYIGNKGDIFFLKPKQRHSIYIDKGVSFTQLHVHFDLFFLDNSPDVKISFRPIEKMTDEERSLFREDVCSAPPVNVPNFIRLSNSLYFEEMLLGIIQEYQTKMVYYEASVKGLFINLWIYLLRELNISHKSNVNVHYGNISKIAALLNSNHQQSFTDHELANMANLSTSYFIRMFKKFYGLSPAKYHNVARIEKAKELIQFTNKTMEEVGTSVGFTSIHAFSRAFKNTEGVPPSFYRRRN